MKKLGFIECFVILGFIAGIMLAYAHFSFWNAQIEMNNPTHEIK